MANKKAKQRNENIIPVQDLIFHCLSKWYWFIISVGVSLLFAVLYILTTPPVYVSSTEILFKEESKGSTGGGSSFKEIGSSQLVSKTDNEIKALLSPGIMREVVKRLGLDIEYRTQGRFFDALIYGNRPIVVKAIDLRKSDAASFVATINDDNSITLTTFVKNNTEFAISPIIANVGDTVQTPIGLVCIEATESFQYHPRNEKIFVNKYIFETVVNKFCSKLSAKLVNEKSSIVKLSIKDISTLRATDILNTITTLYNEKWIEENNVAILKTVDFIQSRIDELGSELREIDRSIAVFKNRNKLTGNDLNNNITNIAIDEKQIKLNNQLEHAKFLKNYITTKNKTDVIPTNTGVDFSGISNLIESYNTTLLDRNRLAANSSDTHPVVLDYDKKLEELFAAINSTIDIYIDNTNREINLTRREVANERSTFSASAEQLKDLQALTRQQNIKNTLYLFLLQKLEETKLNQEFTATNNRIIVPVSGSNTPIEPRQRQSLTLAFIIGLLVPVVFIFVREITNRKVRGRKDIENINIPFVGEIPQYVEKEDKATEKSPVRKTIVKDGKRNVINEAFRVLRTNIEFMNDKDKRSQVIILTSFNPGSGKTFLTMNIAASLAIKGAKVLVIDGDLRHGSASEYAGSPSRGISDYLSGGTNDVSSIIYTPTEYSNLHIIPVGETPPNPTELLHSNKFRTLLEKMKEEYDYIFIDCPPIDIVADTQIIEENADRTLFVIRAGLLNRDMLYELEDMYEEKRLKNMAIILNGTYSSQGRYGYRYGYSYGYGYGYGYGYHYHSKK